MKSWRHIRTSSGLPCTTVSKMGGPPSETEWTLSALHFSAVKPHKSIRPTAYWTIRWVSLPLSNSIGHAVAPDTCKVLILKIYLSIAGMSWFVTNWSSWILVVTISHIRMFFLAPQIFRWGGIKSTQDCPVRKAWYEEQVFLFPHQQKATRSSLQQPSITSLTVNHCHPLERQTLSTNTDMTVIPRAIFP